MTRKIARENAFLLMFEGVCKKDETAEEIFSKATEIRELEADEYVKKVFFGFYANERLIDEVIEKSLLGWKKERISPVSLAVLRLAAYEMLFMEDIPSRVSINEAVELSKKYDEDKARPFINGVLNSIKKELEGKTSDGEKK
jgi:N utilization substance protein B